MRTKTIWAIIAVMLAVLTLGAKQADAQTIDSSGKCHDASGKFAAQSVCSTDAKPKATNTKTSTSTKSDSGKIQAEDGSYVNKDFYSKSGTKSNGGKIKAEDGSMVNKDFYSKTDNKPAPTKAISDTNTGNGYMVYALDRETKTMYCAFAQDNDSAWKLYKAAVDSNKYDVIRGYWASSEAKNFKSDCSS